MVKCRRVLIEVDGIVQGVGFRPFVYRLADRYGLSGWVRNTGRGVRIEVEGEKAGCRAFIRALREEAPPLAVISSLETAEKEVEGERAFRILPSATDRGWADIPPDCDVCADCLKELFDRANRRYRYPFINCTNCGPRYSLITATPYDRHATTMAPFPMCQLCLVEYGDPTSRRFHSQPNACPVCGPQLRLLDPSGSETPGDPVANVVAALAAGKIVAVKGTGGYHLAVDARNEGAVGELRRRKKRDEKPFAVMAADLGQLRQFAQCSSAEGRLLASTERPIVLLNKSDLDPLAPSVAPGNRWHGALLPSTPLQHLLLHDMGSPLVMTSGNVSGEPLAYRDREALSRLSGVADLFLTHDREIQTRIDDSVVRLCAAEPILLRRSRGFVPRGIPLPREQCRVLAIGADLKGAVCLTRGSVAFPSQHFGDLNHSLAVEALEESVRHLSRLLQAEPEVVAHDLHPDYVSTRLARQCNVPAIGVQHHHAHLASCMAENGLTGEALGVIFDGAGYGTDGAVWGGEILLGGYRGFERCAHLRYIPLPGGDLAAREPYRMALSWLYLLHGSPLFEKDLPVLSELDRPGRELFSTMLERRINSPPTSSCGRLFDAVAALVGLRLRSSFEGQAAMELEALAQEGQTDSAYAFRISPEPCLQLDFLPCIAAICDDLAAGRKRSEIARAFHRTVAMAVSEACSRIRCRTGAGRVVLSGGVFQNRILAEDASLLLREAGFEVYRHRLLPPNDGGIAFGQAVIAGALMDTKE